MFRPLALTLSLWLLTGCAHNIAINPELEDIGAPANVAPVSKKVVLYVADNLRSISVTTPGGGGDSITYQPYQDLEAALLKMLRDTFSDATRLAVPPVYDDLKQRHVQYLITPIITTSSSSSRLSGWAPTDFTLKLRFTLIDIVSGAQISREVVGEGNLDRAAEMNGPYIPTVRGSDAPRRAARDAVMKMQQLLLNAPELR